MTDRRHIVVDVDAQDLYLMEEGIVIRGFPVSTSRYGTGNREGSLRTPLGLHRVFEKIGAGAPRGAVFEERELTGAVAPTGWGDAITSRILRLEGMEPGLNRGVGIDSLRRCIYIHGTPEEDTIGTPASKGCIRMTNRDVSELFDLVEEGARVDIIEATKEEIHEPGENQRR
ncbi:MAG: L,D-transpeptidase family protein [Planctomycetota bacterium]|jgi:hypothetical protein